MKKLSRTSLTKKLDDLIRAIVRIREDDTCQICGKKCYGCDSQVSHVVAKHKGASWRRFDLLNVFLACCNCHLYWWHKEVTESGRWFEKKFPARYKYLAKYRGGKPAKISEEEMKKLVEQYEEKLRELKAEGKD